MVMRCTPAAPQSRDTVMVLGRTIKNIASKTVTLLEVKLLGTKKVGGIVRDTGITGVPG